MERDGQLQLYDLVAARLKEAHERVRTLDVPEDVRRALAHRLLVITAAAKQDLGGAARRLEQLMDGIDREAGGEAGGEAGTAALPAEGRRPRAQDNENSEEGGRGDTRDGSDGAARGRRRGGGGERAL